MKAASRSPFVERLRRFSPALARFAGDEATRLVSLAVGIGVLAGAAAGATDAAIHATSAWMLGTATPSREPVAPWRALTMPALGGLAAGILLHLVVRDGRARGIPDVMDATWNHGGHLPLRNALGTAGAAILTIGSGQSGGREGPIVQLAAAVASRVCRATGLPPDEARVLVAAGAASGIAASFDAPIGAAFFALEVVLGDFSMRMFGPVVAATVAGTVVGEALLGDRTALAVPPFVLAHPAELGLYLVLGGLSGLVAVALKRLLPRAGAAVDRLALPGWIRPALAGVVVGLLGAAGAAHVMGNGYPFVRTLLDGSAGVGTLGLIGLLVAKLLATVVTRVGGGGAGLLAPSLGLGAISGVLFGTLVQAAPFPTEAPGAYGTVGMGALAAAVTHAPISIALLLFELTGNYAIILPSLLALSVAGLVDAAFDAEGLYRMELTARGIRIAPDHEALVMYDLTVASLLRTSPHTIPARTDGLTALRTLVGHAEDVLPVVDDDGTYRGALRVRDVRHLHDGTDLDARTAATLAHPIPTLRVDEPLARILPRFVDADVDTLPVVDDTGLLVGMLRERDVLAAYSREVLGHDRLLVRMEGTGPAGRRTDFFRLPPGCAMAGLPVGRAADGSSLRTLDLQRTFGCTVLAVVRTDEQGTEQRLTPTADLLVRAGDRLVLLGPDDGLAAARDRIQAGDPATP